MKEHEKDELLFAEEDDELLFAEEGEEVVTVKAEKAPWKVLIVDDEKIVHDSTKIVLKDFMFDGRHVQFFSAYNSQEAKDILENEDDIAVILLDVVMETEDSGLRLVRYIRNELLNHLVRIVLRTGQPGQAPEESVVIEYDINDYKMKTELTLQRLITTILSALRSYKSLSEIERNRTALQKIVEATNMLHQKKSISNFVTCLISQLTSIYSISEHSFYARSLEDEKGIIKIFVGTGRYAKYSNTDIREIPNSKVSNLIDLANSEEPFIIEDGKFIGHHKSINGVDNYVYLEGIHDFEDIDLELFILFSTNISVAFDNIYLSDKLIETQKELIGRLCEVIETRSEETANHVKRVSNVAYFIAKKYGFSDERAELLRMVAPLHDVGKIGIPESILNKPARLTEEEFDFMKRHAIIGNSILKDSGLELLEAGAIVAKEHHERWDGKGYPQGLKGEDIHIYGRMVLIADIFDALSHDRVYKKAWEMSKVIDYFEVNKGKIFDPKLVEIFLEYIDEIQEIANKTDETNQIN